MTEEKSDDSARQILVLLGVWLIAAVVLTILALPNLSSPGLYYDEAVNGGLARDFAAGPSHGIHMPGTVAVSLFGRPFPVLVQWYSGAVKPWLIIPSLLCFDATTAVLRATSLFWYLVALLICMLWTRRLLGLSAAILLVPILGFDPSCFFPGIVDWGPILPSFLCRFAGYYFLLRWWRDRKNLSGFLGGLALGLGFFAKIDFVVILAGSGIAVAVVYGKDILAFLRRSFNDCTWLCLGFCLGAGPMVLQIVCSFPEAMRKTRITEPVKLTEKLSVVAAMYDGSYFYRLVNSGGKLVLDSYFCLGGAFGWAVVLCAILLTLRIVRRRGEAAERQRLAFLLLSAILITIGMLLLPPARHIHHHLAVYPFPHLIVVAAVLLLWRKSPSHALGKWGLRTCAVVIAVAVIGGHVLAMRQTQCVLAATGGRGNWSDSIQKLCDDVKDQRDLAVISLDWGFNEQLCYLCTEQPLLEPLWSEQPPPVSPMCLYLVHPSEYATFGSGMEFCREAEARSSS